MNDDLIEQLRRGFGGIVPPICDKAANRIEQLQRERDALAAAMPSIDWANPATLNGVLCHAAQAEPVAWLYRLAGGRIEFQDRQLDHYYDRPGGGYVKGEPLYAAPPADNEAVRLLREAQCWVGASLSDEIDAYLAKVGK